MEQDIDKAFLKEYESTKNLRNSVNREIGESRIKIWEQFQEFFRLIVLVSLGILGITKFFTEIQVPEYFLWSKILYFATILFTLLITRESLDKDAKGLQKFQDEENDIVNEKLELMYKYIVGGVMTRERYAEYRKELLDSSATKRAQEQKEEMATRRQNRTKDEKFTAELVLFLFLSASFFTIIALLGKINTILILCAIVFIFMLTFLNAASFVINLISDTLHWLKRLYNEE